MDTRDLTLPGSIITLIMIVWLEWLSKIFLFQLEKNQFFCRKLMMGHSPSAIICENKKLKITQYEVCHPETNVTVTFRGGMTWLKRREEAARGCC